MAVSKNSDSSSSTPTHFNVGLRPFYNPTETEMSSTIMREKTFTAFTNDNLKFVDTVISYTQ